MNRALLNKELRLSLHPTAYIFMALVAMLLIPGYPYLIPYFFACLGTFYIMMDGREQNDVYFTALLPIAKRQVVLARFATVVLTQLAQILLSVPVILLKPVLMPGWSNEVGLEAGVALLGYALGLYAVFNLLFLPWFYKTAYNAGFPFMVTMVAMMAYIVAAEVSLHLLAPRFAWLDSALPADQLRQLPVLAAGLVVYVAATVLAYRTSARRFERIDL